MIAFEVYKNTESTLVSEGTVAALAGKGGKIAFIESNLKRLEKRVIVIVSKADGTSAMISCSEAVSKGVRNGTITEHHIAGLEVLTGDNGVAFISSTGSRISYNIDDLKITELSASATRLEDLIAL